MTHNYPLFLFGIFIKNHKMTIILTIYIFIKAPQFLRCGSFIFDFDHTCKRVHYDNHLKQPNIQITSTTAIQILFLRHSAVLLSEIYDGTH